MCFQRNLKNVEKGVVKSRFFIQCKVPVFADSSKKSLKTDKMVSNTFYRNLHRKTFPTICKKDNYILDKPVAGPILCLKTLRQRAGTFKKFEVYIEAANGLLLFLCTTNTFYPDIEWNSTTQIIEHLLMILRPLVTIYENVEVGFNIHLRLHICQKFPKINRSK